MQTEATAPHCDDKMEDQKCTWQLPVFMKAVRGNDDIFPFLFISRDVVIIKLAIRVSDLLCSYL